MRLTRLQLEHFKNYQQLDVDLSDVSVGILIGDNGQGKTNFLESIAILALSKGLQSVPVKDMVDWYYREEDTGLPEVLRLSAEVSHGDSSSRLELLCGQGRKYPKTMRIDDVKMSAHDYIGHLKVVLFTPQDMNLVMLSPALRRRYVNLVLSQVDRLYLKHLSQYNVILKSRNKLLGQISEGLAQSDELEYWDQQLAEHGAYLLWKRRHFFSSLNDQLSRHYADLSQESDSKYQLLWKKDWHCDDLNQFHDAFAGYLRDKQQRDIHSAGTCGGPHREDFSFVMNDRDLADFGSRGECRSAILSLKLSELAYIRSETGESPVLLFDDVFSELDLTRQKNLLEMFDVDQVFITTTHLDFEVPGAQVWKVEDGTISPL